MFLGAGGGKEELGSLGCNSGERTVFRKEEMEGAKGCNLSGESVLLGDSDLTLRVGLDFKVMWFGTLEKTER